MRFAKKLEGFPSVNYINLYEYPDRKQFMEKQFAKYGMANTHCYQTERYSKIKNTLKVHIPACEDGVTYPIIDNGIGATISHLNSIRNWYNNTDEEYAIFVEDDISFASIDRWNFTWQEFVAHIPEDWECMQLIRMIADPLPKEMHELTLRLRWGRYWGAHWMMKRSHAKRLLDMCTGPADNEYTLISCTGKYQPVTENVLLMNYNTLYNFPLLTENWSELKYTLGNQPDDNEDEIRRGRNLCNNVVKYYWQTLGSTLNLDEAMEIDNS
jgi:hypothetical protein